MDLVVCLYSKSLVSHGANHLHLGINYHTVYDGLYVFDLEINQWLPPADVVHSVSQHYSVGLIVGLSVFGAIVGSASVVLLGYWLMKRHGSTIHNLFTSIRRNIWNPR